MGYIWNKMFVCEPNCVTDQESQMTKILSRLGVRFMREPHIFALKWNHTSRINIQRGMVPDFYLPDHGVYLELTGGESNTKASQHKRNRIRQIHEFIPHAKVRLITGREWRKICELLEKDNMEEIHKLILKDSNHATDPINYGETDAPAPQMPEDIDLVIMAWKMAKAEGDYKLADFIQAQLFYDGWYLERRDGEVMLRPIYTHTKDLAA